MPGSSTENRGWQNDPDYGKNHHRVRNERGRAVEKLCEECGGQAQNWSQIHGTDGADPTNYRALCLSCHRFYDFGSSREFCRRGHPRTPENTVEYNGKRYCRICRHSSSIRAGKKYATTNRVLLASRARDRRKKEKEIAQSK